MTFSDKFYGAIIFIFTRGIVGFNKNPDDIIFMQYCILLRAITRR